jgi:DNA-binding GntR family transcriptional regulator
VLGLAQYAVFLSGSIGSMPLFLLASMVSGFGGGAIFPLFAAMTADYFGENNNATNYGLVYSSKLVSGLVGSGLGAVVVAAWGYGGAFLLAGAIGLLCGRRTDERDGSRIRGCQAWSGGAAGTAALERPVPLRQAVTDVIADMIINGELLPGEHLVEQDLAAQLGVSRQPVREALQRLHSEGWVDLRPGLGAFVHTPTAAEADQLLAARTLLEAESARLAAVNATPETIEQLWKLQATGEAALAADDEIGMVAANSALHAHILVMSANKIIAELIALVDRRVRWYYRPIARARGKEAWDEHRELIEVIAGGNGKRAGDLMRRHTERTRKIYQQAAAAAAKS